MSGGFPIQEQVQKRLVSNNKTTRRHIPQVKNLHSHYPQNHRHQSVTGAHPYSCVLYCTELTGNF
jgi:hypothetical protein